MTDALRGWTDKVTYMFGTYGRNNADQAFRETFIAIRNLTRNIIK